MKAAAGSASIVERRRSPRLLSKSKNPECPVPLPDKDESLSYGSATPRKRKAAFSKAAKTAKKGPVANLGKKRIAVGTYEQKLAEKLLMKIGAEWVTRSCTEVETELPDSSELADHLKVLSSLRSCALDETAEELLSNAEETEAKVPSFDTDQYDRLEGWLSDWELDGRDRLQKVANFLGILDTEELKLEDNLEHENQNVDSSLALWIVEVAREVKAEPISLFDFESKVCSTSCGLSSTMTQLDPEPLSDSIGMELAVFQAGATSYSEHVDATNESAEASGDEEEHPSGMERSVFVPFGSFESGDFDAAHPEAVDDPGCVERLQLIPYADEPGNVREPLTPETDYQTELPSKVSSASSSPKSILKPVLRPCSQACQCGQCVSERIRAKMASRFSEEQMHGTDKVTSTLLSVIKELRELVLRSRALPQGSSKQELKRINETLKNGTRKERAAKELLGRMRRDCCRYRRILRDSKPVGRRIVFADEEGKQLNHVKHF